MEILDSLLSKSVNLIPTAVAVVAVVLVIWAVRLVLEKRNAGAPDRRFRSQLIIMVLSFLGLLVVILALPVSDAMIGQLLGLLGILLSAAIALSATTFVGNIMAGLMLRAVKNFRLGDFMRIGDHFGRVSERGLFHIEIQTEDRDLTTLPNMYLVTNPVKVIRSSGTLVTAEVSLGYDVPRADVETALLTAATDAKLEEPFVHVISLGDFSITYRVAGLLTEVKSLLSTRSKLRANMVDSLHGAGIEIVSPTFMNQRVLKPEKVFIPDAVAVVPPDDQSKDLPETVVFDKADEAESLEKLQGRHVELLKELEELKKSLSDAIIESERNRIQTKIETSEARLNRLAELIALQEKSED